MLSLILAFSLVSCEAKTSTCTISEMPYAGELADHEKEFAGINGNKYYIHDGAEEIADFYVQYSHRSYHKEYPWFGVYADNQTLAVRKTQVDALSYPASNPGYRNCVFLF